MARRGFGTAFVAAVSACLACTPFGGAPGGDTSDAPGSDGGSPAMDGAPPGLDGGETADSSLSEGRFCGRASHPNCADFDGPHVGEWGDPANLREPQLITGATLAVAANAGREGRGLRATLPAGVEEGKVHHELRVAGVTEFSLSADVLIETPSGPYTTGSVTVVGIVYGTDTGTPAIEAKISPSSVQNAKLAMYVRTGTGSQNAFVTSGTNLEVPYDTWVRITVHGALLGAMGNIEARVTTDRGGVIEHTSLPRSPALGTQTTRALIGLQRYQATTDAPLVVRYDNVIGGPLQ